jgi:hypothetical protein
MAIVVLECRLYGRKRGASPHAGEAASPISAATIVPQPLFATTTGGTDDAPDRLVYRA